ncbi:MAG: NHL repeat-containing protein [bacterium]
MKRTVLSLLFVFLLCTPIMAEEPSINVISEGDFELVREKKNFSSLEATAIQPQLSLKFLFSIDSPNANQKFNLPQGVFFHKQTGKIYVVDTGSNMIYRANKDGAGIEQVLKNVEFKSPYDVVINRDNKIYISQLGKNYVEVYNLDGQMEKKIPEENEAKLLTERGILNTNLMPGRLYYDDSEQKLFIIDRKSAQVYVFSDSGSYLFHFGGKGKGKGNFSMPSGITIDKLGRIYITEKLGVAVQIFNPNGNFFKSFGKHGQREENFSCPSGISTISFGKDSYLCIIDALRQQVKFFNLRGKFVSQAGSFGREDGSFSYPVDIDVNPDDHIIYILEKGSKRVQAFTLTKATK